MKAPRRPRRRRRPLARIYHLIWAFAVSTMALMWGMVHASGSNRPDAPSLNWWAVIAAGGAISLGQASSFVVVYRRMRRRLLERARAERQRRRAVRERLHLVRAEADQLAVEDPMTGLFNQRHMRRQLAAEFERHRRYGLPLACAMIDADFFKRINDAFGHPTGDAVIRTMAQCLRARARQSDFLGHYGGDEFLVLMPNTTLEAAARLADRLRRVIASDVARFSQRQVAATCSIGVAAYEPVEEGQGMMGQPPFAAQQGTPQGGRATDGGIDGPERLLECADQAMYEAKRRGRNRVCLWFPDAIHEYVAPPDPLPVVHDKEI
jgi:diguanylate cyclase (GGDEF)-like protein